MLAKKSKINSAMNAESYTKMDKIEHILSRPDMYVGSIRPKKYEEYTSPVENTEFNIEKRSGVASPAILRIFIEPLANAVDNCARSLQRKIKTTKISIDIDPKTGETTIWNDGCVIPVELHPKEKCYVHSMIFGDLLTGSNYDDSQERVDISGRNGLGIKLTNVYSKKFIVEGLDPTNRKLLSQKWENNMRKVSNPIVRETTLKKGYTKITYIPDFSLFGLEGYTTDILSLYKKYMIDARLVTKVPVFFNGDEIPVKSLIDYARLYYPLKDEEKEDEEDEEEIDEENEEENEDGEKMSKAKKALKKKDEILHVKTSDCDMVLLPSDSGFEAISFASGIYTPLGGTHVDAWSEAIFRPILKKLNKPKKPQLNISDVKKYFKLFVIASVKNPEFNDQSKTRLEGPIVEAEIKKSHLANISRWSVMDTIQETIRQKEMVVLKKAERKRRVHEYVEGLDPANNEGGAKGRQCTLILVEGLSAKSYAVTGIQEGAFGKSGRDWFGVIALRGKLLNCRNATPLAISKNKVVVGIIKALGLEYGVDYTNDQNYNKLRYGRVLVITDADTDGLHILGLLQNMFHALFPSLLQREESFFTCMQTPIVRIIDAKKGDKLFYDEREYQEYSRKTKEKKEKKYYKGLGSSSDIEIMETFAKKLVHFRDDDKTPEAMIRAFDGNHADLRKKWLLEYDPNKIVLKWNGNTPETKSISFADYVDTELIKFSIDDCNRNIPCLVDGLKQGHRKVLYTCFRRKNLRYSGKSMKVAQLGPAVAFDTEYHHGEQNLWKTVTSMAQAHVGSNNIPLLTRDGAFGTRLEGGKDAASGRYIWTRLDYMTRYIFHPDDDVLLDYIVSEEHKIEPKFYVPIIPMLLVNGCIVGIGTGWSSKIPCYNPLDLVEAIKTWLDVDGNMESSELSELALKPWYRGFKGEIEHDGKRYVSWGQMHEEKKGEYRITELPVGYWTSNFIANLEKLKEQKKIKSVKNYCTPTVVDVIIGKIDGGVECTSKGLKLSRKHNTSNMTVLQENGSLKQYKKVEEILDAYCRIRLVYYVKRKKYKLQELEHRIKFMGNKKRFLEEVRDGEMKLYTEIGKGKRRSRKTTEIVQELEKRGYDRDIKSKTCEHQDDEDLNEEKEEEEEEDLGSSGYEYLLRLQISSITEEKINKLGKDIENTRKQHEELTEKTEKDLWKEDLDNFCEAYKKYLVILDREKPKEKSKKKGK